MIERDPIDLADAIYQMHDHLTGIFIRAQIDGKWQPVDIADGRLPVDQLVEWLRSGPPEREMAVRVCLLLLGRDQNAVEGVPRATVPHV